MFLPGLLQRTDRLDNVQPESGDHRGHRSRFGATVGDIPIILFMQINRKVSRNETVNRYSTGSFPRSTSQNRGPKDAIIRLSSNFTHFRATTEERDLNLGSQVSWNFMFKSCVSLDSHRVFR